MRDEGILYSFSDPDLAEPLVKALRSLKIDKKLTLMHVCGTHEHSLAKAGIRSMLPENLKLVAGPGCPVCVCPARDIDLAIQAASRKNVIVATFGDMFRVPSGNTSLEEMKAGGSDIRVIYSPLDAIKIAADNTQREVVFMAVGFETTAGPIAALLRGRMPVNLSVLSSIRLVPPALRYLIENGKGTLDGFILPGHVSTVLGRDGYLFLETEYGMPGVIAGFEAVDILSGILKLVEIVQEGGPAVVLNLYKRFVSEEGNVKARKLIDSVFRISDAAWRGIGVIPDSSLVLREEYENLDAVRRLDLVSDDSAVDVLPGCICHRVILGESEPEECPLFGSKCTPRIPFGPCMVSSEGTCRARYQYRSF